MKYWLGLMVIHVIQNLYYGYKPRFYLVSNVKIACLIIDLKQIFFA